LSELAELEELHRTLCSQQIFYFPKQGKRSEASERKGIYVIMSPKEKVVYVGGTPRAKDGIRQRLRDHLYGRSSFTRNWLCGKGSKLRKGYKYKFLKVPSARRRVLLECYAIAHLCPSYVGLGKKRS
jgi:hypothetical protein